MLWFTCFTALDGNYFLSLHGEIKRDRVANDGLFLSGSLSLGAGNFLPRIENDLARVTHIGVWSFINIYIYARTPRGTQSDDIPAGAVVPLCPKITIKASIEYQPGS